MDFRQRLPVHFPGQHDLVDLDLSPWHRDDVVVDLAFLEVRVYPHKVDMLGTFFESATVFDDLLQTDACPPCCSC